MSYLFQVAFITPLNICINLYHYFFFTRQIIFSSTSLMIWHVLGHSHSPNSRPQSHVRDIKPRKSAYMRKSLLQFYFRILRRREHLQQDYKSGNHISLSTHRPRPFAGLDSIKLDERKVKFSWLLEIKTFGPWKSIWL